MSEKMVVVPSEQFTEELAKNLAKHVMDHLQVQSASNSKEEFLTTREALEMLRISAPTFRKMVKSGTVKVYGKGTHHQRYKRSEIEKALGEM
jgi:excisionase family DNA binding protein